MRTLYLLFFTLPLHLFSQDAKNQLPDSLKNHVNEGYIIFIETHFEKIIGTVDFDVNFSFVLQEGQQYYLSCLSDSLGLEKMKLTLRDSHKKPIYSTTLKQKNNYEPILFTCEKTGIYYLEVETKNHNFTSGYAVVAIKDTRKKHVSSIPWPLEDDCLDYTPVQKNQE